MKYPHEKLFLVCTGKRCSDEARGLERGACIQEELKIHNKKLGRKGVVRVCAVSCLDLCDYGPNMVVEPDGTTYSHLDRETARAAYDGECGDGPLRPDLELQGLPSGWRGGA
ncbi:MAG TPA: (2Fe-2S) ferredoxin domain-containing protein [Thermoanaerobaculia bacterium]